MQREALAPCSPLRRNRSAMSLLGAGLIFFGIALGTVWTAFFAAVHVVESTLRADTVRLVDSQIRNSSTVIQNPVTTAGTITSITSITGAGSFHLMRTSCSSAFGSDYTGTAELRGMDQDATCTVYFDYTFVVIPSCVITSSSLLDHPTFTTITADRMVITGKPGILKWMCVQAAEPTPTPLNHNVLTTGSTLDTVKL